MTYFQVRIRRVLPAAARCRTAAPAVIVVALSLWAMLSPGVSSVLAAPVDGGPLVVLDKPPDGSSIPSAPLTTGTSATQFSLLAPAGAACTGDSANSNPAFLVQTYMVPAAVEPSTLTFDADGPVPAGTGATFRQPLYTTTGSPAVSMLTGLAPTPPGPGPVINIPAFSLSVYAPGDVPAGTYNVGIACTSGPASTTQLDRFWNVQMTMAAATAGEANPAGLTWTVVESATGTTTTTSTTSTTLSATTTTASSGSTTTTEATTTTTTAATTTTSDASVETTFTPSGITGTTPGASSGVLSRTGSSPLPFVAASALLLIFGRMGVLLARRSEVRPSARR